MQSFNTKVDSPNAGDSSFDASEFNQLSQELENFITDTGETLSSGNLHQLGQAAAIYAAGGEYYTDSGTANTYVLNLIGSKQAPSAYFNGMRVRFKAGNANTGASTVNVNSLGVVNIKQTDYSSALNANAIKANSIVSLTYDSNSSSFILISSSTAASSLPTNYIQGLAITNDGTNPNTVIDIGAGSCRDSSDAVNIMLTSGTVNCATTGVNGLDTGSLGASTDYYLYAISGSSGTGFLASASTTPSLPTGYSYSRTIGTFRTDSNSHIIPAIYTRINNLLRAEYKSLIQEYSNSSPPTTATSLTLTGSCPLSNSRALVMGKVYSGSSQNATIILHDLITGVERPLAFTVYDGSINNCGGSSMAINTSSKAIEHYVNKSGSITSYILYSYGYEVIL